MCNDVAHFTVIKMEVARCNNKVGRLGPIEFHECLVFSVSCATRYVNI